MEYFRDPYRITTDKSQMDKNAIQEMLHGYCWEGDLPPSVLEAGMRSSLCWGLFHGEKQIGFARIISDYAIFAYLGDFVIHPAYRRRGLGRWLLECIWEHPQLQTIRRWVVITRHNRDFFSKMGFQPLTEPEDFMEIFRL